jgi:hypothetical protein
VAGRKADVPVELSHQRQRSIVVAALVCLCLAAFAWPDPGRSGDGAHAALPACPTSPTALSGLVNGNTLALGNGTTVSPCIPDAPIHMRIGYSDGGTGGSLAGSTTQFTTDGITFPDGKLTRAKTGCTLGVTSDSKIAKPTILRFADGTQSPGPSNVTTYPNAGFLTCGSSSNLYANRGWPTTFAQNDDAMLVHMRLKNLKISRNAFMTVVPQSDPANPTPSGSGDYGLTFTPANQGSAGWNIGDSCVYTDLWLRADTHIKVNIFGINTSVGALAGDDSLWGSILSSIATQSGIPGLELDGWVYYMNTNKGGDCTGTPTTLNLPSTTIGVSP